MDVIASGRGRGGGGERFSDDPVTQLVHDASLLGLNVDTVRLYERSDPYYEIWIGHVVGRIYETKRRTRAEEERLAKKATRKK